MWEGLKIIKSTMDYFCDTKCSGGTPVGFYKTFDKDFVVCPSSTSLRVDGIILNDVITNKISRVCVLEEGYILTDNIDSSFDNNSGIYPVYVDYNNNRFTTRKHINTSDEIGLFIYRVNHLAKLKIRI